MKLNQFEEESLVAWIEHHYPDMSGYLVELDDLGELHLHVMKVENILQRISFNTKKYQRELNEEDPDNVVYDSFLNE